MSNITNKLAFLGIQKELAEGGFVDGDKTKLDTVNSDVANLQTALDGKVDDAQVLTNVPAGAVFTDTTYSVGDGGLTQINFTTARSSKLDGIETGANVTDTANVTAAGALMDSEVTNLAQVKAFNSADYATAAHTHTIQSLSDVNAMTPTDGQVLTWDNANSRWDAGAGGDVSVDGGTAISTYLAIQKIDGGSA